MRTEFGIDLIKMYSLGSTKEWNTFLKASLKTRSTTKLLSVRKELQIGMRDTVKNNLNSNGLTDWYIRLIRSIEDTLKLIWREAHPNQIYTPGKHEITLKAKENKKKLDIDFELWLRKNSY